jgi:hypothetical protein
LRVPVNESPVEISSALDPSLQELVSRQSSLCDDGTQGAAWQISRMKGNHRDFAGSTVDPELVAPLPGGKHSKP